MNVNIEERGEAIWDLDGAFVDDGERFLSISFVDTSAGAAIVDLLRGVDVERLFLNDTELDDRLEVLQDLTTLNRLDIGCSKRLTGEFLRYVPASVEDLFIRDCVVEDKWMRQLERLKNLKHLGVSGVTRFDEGFDVVAGLPRLEALGLHDVPISDRAIRSIDKLERLKSLQLFRCGITDASLPRIAKLTGLTDLDLSNTNISETGLPELHGMQQLKKLDVRTLDENLKVVPHLQVSDEAIRQLYLALPKCEISPWRAEFDKQRKQARRKTTRRKTEKVSFDRAAWVASAGEFMRGLPDRLDHVDPDELEFEAAPPLKNREFQKLAKALQQPLPEPLKRFLLEGSAEIRFRYCWEPKARSKPRKTLQSLISRKDIWGGAAICPASQIAEMQRICGEYANDPQFWLVDFPDEQALWKRSVPFVMMDNHDFLALDLGPTKRRKNPPVVYLCHDGDSSEIAPSFDVFMHEWQNVCYVGPEIWLLEPFRDEGTGHLDSQGDAASALRSMFGMT